MALKALFTDIGGVLLTNGWGSKGREKAAQHFQLDLAEMTERHHLTFDTYEIGKLSLEDYLKRIVFYEPRAFSMDDFREFMFTLSQPYPEMLTLLRDVKARHKLKVAVISNEGRELTEYRIRQFGLGDFVDFFVSSCFVHFRKPDTEIFKMAIDMAQVPLSQAVYIEDRPLFAEVSNGLGLQAILHRSYKETKAALAALGID